MRRSARLPKTVKRENILGQSQGLAVEGKDQRYRSRLASLNQGSEPTTRFFTLFVPFQHAAIPLLAAKTCDVFSARGIISTCFHRVAIAAQCGVVFLDEFTELRPVSLSSTHPTNGFLNLHSHQCQDHWASFGACSSRQHTCHSVEGHSAISAHRFGCRKKKTKNRTLRNFKWKRAANSVEVLV